MFMSTEASIETNSKLVVDHLTFKNEEGNLKPATRADHMDRLSRLCLFHKTKPFSKMMLEDLCYYLDTLRRTESEDPTNKWIGTYNFSLVKMKSVQSLVSIKQTLNTKTRITEVE